MTGGQRTSFANDMEHGRVIWITGLSGSGKSSIARELLRKFRLSGQTAVLLDGDEVRETIADPHVKHDPESRLTNGLRISRLAQMIASQGFSVVVATMSLFREIHAWNRENLPQYFEVFVRVELEILKKRDARKLYTRALTGAAADVVGVQLIFEEPLSPNLVLVNNDECSSFTGFANQIWNHAIENSCGK